MKLRHKKVFPLAIKQAKEQQEEKDKREKEQRKLEKELVKIEREKTLEEARDTQARARSKREQQVDTDEKSKLDAKPDDRANTAPALPDGFKFHYVAS